MQSDCVMHGQRVSVPRVLAARVGVTMAPVLTDVESDCGVQRGGMPAPCSRMLSCSIMERRTSVKRPSSPDSAARARVRVTVGRASRIE